MTQNNHPAEIVKRRVVSPSNFLAEKELAAKFVESDNATMHSPDPANSGETGITPSIVEPARQSTPPVASDANESENPTLVISSETSQFRSEAGEACEGYLVRKKDQMMKPMPKVHQYGTVLKKNPEDAKAIANALRDAKVCVEGKKSRALSWKKPFLIALHDSFKPKDADGYADAAEKHYILLAAEKQKEQVDKIGIEAWLAGMSLTDAKAIVRGQPKPPKCNLPINATAYPHVVAILKNVDHAAYATTKKAIDDVLTRLEQDAVAANKAPVAADAPVVIEGGSQ